MSHVGVCFRPHVRGQDRARVMFDGRAARSDKTAAISSASAERRCSLFRFWVLTHVKLGDFKVLKFEIALLGSVSLGGCGEMRWVPVK